MRMYLPYSLSELTPSEDNTYEEEQYIQNKFCLDLTAILKFS